MVLGKTIYQAAAELETANQTGAVCSIVSSHGSTPRRSGSKMLVYPDGAIIGSVGGGELENRVIQEALKAMGTGRATLLSYSMTDPARGDPGVCGGQVEVYVEPIVPRPILVVIGMGHVGKAVASLAHWLGFYVAVSDDRPEFCSPESVPDADAYYPFPLDELSERLAITPWTYLVLTTRGFNLDVKGLPALLNTNAAYIGVIGSRRRWAEACKQMVESGVSQEKLAAVHSPIGLELNAETPEEIAVSILAEIIMLRNGGDGAMMSDKKKHKQENTDL